MINVKGIWSKVKEEYLLYTLILLQDRENLLFLQGSIEQILHSPPCQPVKKYSSMVKLT